MKEISFIKYSGAGNDFILIDEDLNELPILTPVIIRKLCERHNGIGADGILVFSKSKENNFNLKYFNADGSSGSLCGNGARCAIHYASQVQNIEMPIVQFIFNGKKYSGEIIAENSIKFYFEIPEKIYLNQKIKIDNYAINYSFIDTGSPHVLIRIDELVDIRSGQPVSTTLNDLQVNSIGSEIRNNSNFAPDGVNVNFIDHRNEGIFIRTYERGVEDETLACATGAAAVGLSEFMNGIIEPPVIINTYGGEKFIVDFNFENNKIKNLSLLGNVEQVFTGKINLS